MICSLYCCLNIGSVYSEANKVTISAATVPEMLHMLLSRTFLRITMTDVYIVVDVHVSKKPMRDWCHPLPSYLQFSLKVHASGSLGGVAVGGSFPHVSPSLSHFLSAYITIKLQTMCMPLSKWISFEMEKSRHGILKLPHFLSVCVTQHSASVLCFCLDVLYLEHTVY